MQLVRLVIGLALIGIAVGALFTGNIGIFARGADGIVWSGMHEKPFGFWFAFSLYMGIGIGLLFTAKRIAAGG